MIEGLGMDLRLGLDQAGAAAGQARRPTQTHSIGHRTTTAHMTLTRQVVLVALMVMLIMGVVSGGRGGARGQRGGAKWRLRMRLRLGGAARGGAGTVVPDSTGQPLQILVGITAVQALAAKETHLLFLLLLQVDAVQRGQLHRTHGGGGQSNVAQRHQGVEHIRRIQGTGQWCGAQSGIH